jgi:hypothetical protein
MLPNRASAAVGRLCGCGLALDAGRGGISILGLHQAFLPCGLSHTHTHPALPAARPRPRERAPDDGHVGLATVHNLPAPPSPTPTNSEWVLTAPTWARLGVSQARCTHGYTPCTHLRPRRTWLAKLTWYPQGPFQKNTA